MLRITRPTKRRAVPEIIYFGTEKRTFMVYIRRVMFQTDQDVIIVKASSFSVEDDVIIFTSGPDKVALFNKCDVEKILQEEPTAQAVEV